MDVGRLSLGSLQSTVGLLAGLVSVTSAVYSAVRYVHPSTGQVVAVVRAAKADQPVPGTTVEVLTRDDLVVATLSARDDGSVTQVLAGGPYRVRVSAPRFDPQTRDVLVQPGATAEVRFQLASRDEGPKLAATERARRADGGPVSRSVGAAGRFLHKLGL